MLDDRRIYLHAKRGNLRSDVDGLTHTKQLLNLVCIIYNKITAVYECKRGLATNDQISVLSLNFDTTICYCFRYACQF